MTTALRERTLSTLVPRSRRVRRLIPAVLITLALVVALVLNPAISKVYATNVFGSLRAPGEPAFIAGHRGDRSSAPENTIPALESALASSMAFVETDVQMTKDGVPVLMHDATVDRTTNGTGPVSDFTFSQLRKLDAGKWYDKKFAKTRVPSLAEFLALVKPTEKKVLLELKDFWSESQVERVVQVIRESGVEGRITIASFNFTTLMNVERIGPSLPRVIIMRDLPEDPVGLANHFGAIAILTSPRSLETYPDAVTNMHEAGLGLLVYTLNSDERWSEAVALGVDGIITDEPSSLDRWLAHTAPGT